MTAAPASPGLDGTGGERTIAADSATVAGWTLASRLTGLVRVVVVAAVLGPTFFGNIFQTTNSLPLIVYNFVAGSLITAIVVPPLVARLDRNDRIGAADLASRFAGLLLASLGGLALVTVLLSPVIVRLLTIGVDESAADARRVTWVFLIMVLPQILGYGLVGVCVAAQNARQRFHLPSAAPIIENVGVIATLLISASVFGTGTGVDEAGGAQLALLGIGSTLAVAAHAGLQWWGAHRAGLTIRPRLGWREPEIAEMVRITVPSMGSTGLAAGRYLALAVVAGTIPGGWVAFQIGLNFYNLPVAIGGRPVGTALLPRLSRFAQAGRSAEYRSAYWHGLGLAGSVAIPAAAAYLLLSQPIAGVLAFGEMATSDGVRLLAYSLVGLSVGVFAESSFEVARQAAYARREAGKVFRAAAVRASVTGVVIAVAVAALDGPVLLVGLGVAVSLGDSVGTVGLHRRLVRGGRQLASAVAAWEGTLLATIIALTPAVAIYMIVPSDGVVVGRALFLAVATLSGALYLTVHRVVPASPLLELLGMSEPDAGGSPAGTSAPSLRLYTGALFAVVLGGIGAGIAPMITVVAIAGAALVGAVVARPQWATYIYLAAMPFVAGIGRGVVVPFLRPTEVLQLALTVGLLIVLYVKLLDGYRPTIRLTRLDVSLSALAIAGSVVPLAWIFVRGTTPTVDDVLGVFPFWKYLALYAMFRASVTTRDQVKRCLHIVLATAVGVAVVAVAQSAGLPGVRDLLASAWAPEGGLSFTSNGRASTTFGSPIATADYLAFGFGLALTMLLAGYRRSLVGAAAAAVLVGLLATGQFTAGLALVAVTATVLWVTGQIRAAARFIVPALPLVAIAGGVMLLRRLADTDDGTGLPLSWLGRIDNISNFVLPELHGWQLVLGVRPNPIIDAPETWRDQIFIESGHLWLLWIGGIPLLIAFVVFMVTAIRTVLAVARTSFGPVAWSACAATAALVSIAVLTTFDPHIALRGGADLAFALIALALVPWRSGVHLPWRSVRTLDRLPALDPVPAGAR